MPIEPVESLIWVPDPITDPLPLERMFPVDQPLMVELGSGDGSFLLEYARAHPETNFLAVERLLGRLRKIDRKARQAGLDNVRGLRIEASYCLGFLLPAHRAQAIHVYFPDPWPKRRHHRRRLINAHFPDLAWRALAPSGHIFLRTDNGEYFTQITQVFGASHQFLTRSTPTELLRYLTDFERDFTAQGIPTRHAAFQAIVDA